jgi:histidinol-phosphate aminotransferase
MLEKEIQSIDPRESYPIDYYSFIEEISRFLAVETTSIYPGLTHNQLIQRVVHAISKPEDSIMLVIPDKGIYSKIANNYKLNIQGVELTERFELNLELMLGTIDSSKPRAVIFSSPHYPTANQLNEEDILKLAQETEIPIIVDESYVEFGKYSLVNQVKNFTNLIIVRSFTKAWGLGATSCAYVISDPSFVKILKETYSFEEIPPIHLLLTNHILQTPYRFVELINSFVAERKRVIEQLKILNGLSVYKSDTNFLFIKYKNDVKELSEHLSSKGIIVRTFEEFPDFKHRDKTFLVTLGDSNINDRFVVALIEILESLL